MTKGVYTSPYPYETRDSNGNVIAQFLVNFTPASGTDPSALTITSITAYNVQGSGLSRIQVTRADGAVFNLPLPTKGSKTAVPVTDGQGNPTTVSCYSAAVVQADINSDGFFVLSDIAGYTCS